MHYFAPSRIMQIFSIDFRPRLAYFCLMSNNAITHQLTELANISAGYPLRKSASGLSAGDVHMIQLQHVDTDTNIDWNTVPKVELPSAREPVWLTDQDVIFASRGTRTFAYPLRNTPEHTVCAPQFFVLSPVDRGVVLSEFLAWQINQRPAQEYLVKRSTTSTIANVRRRALEEMPIVVPPLGVQTSIVDFWHAARKERGALNRLIQNREKQLESLAIELFQHSRRTTS